MKASYFIAKLALNIPYVRKYNIWYRLLGVHIVGRGKEFNIAFLRLIGSYHNLYLHNNVEINLGCLLVARDRCGCETNYLGNQEGF